MKEHPAHYGGDFEVVSALLDWAAAGDAGAMVTVLRTWGSSPRPPGSLAAIRRRDGRLVGSVSGGCVETHLVERYTAGELADCPTRVAYGVDPAGAATSVLPCGGQLELLVEEPEAESLRPIASAVAAGELLERRLDLETGEVVLGQPSDATEFRFEDQTVSKRFGPPWRLVLIGAGQLADALARIALTLDFRVTLCDPRPGYGSDLPGVECRREMPDDLIATLPHPHRTAVVTLAHDPKLDDLALIEALPSGFFYVGALGSRRSAASRRERLRQFGIADTALARLSAPVGLDIGSHRPAEIAVAIAAELIAARQ